jgi:AcrR family transcriptional regulator
MDAVIGESEEDLGPAGCRRRALALAAYARIARDGFEGLRTRDVAADVGINIGTLHYYFPTKEALIRAAVRHMTAKFAATLSSAGSPAEQLRGHLEHLRHSLKTDQELWAVSGEIALRAAREEDIAVLVCQGNDQWFAFLRELVTRGIEDGSLVSDLQPECVAAVLVAAIKGVSITANGSVHPERIDQTFDQLERWLGLVPPAPAESGRGCDIT